MLGARAVPCAHVLCVERLRVEQPDVHEAGAGCVTQCGHSKGHDATDPATALLLSWHGHVCWVEAFGLAAPPAHDEVGDEAQALSQEHTGTLHGGVPGGWDRDSGTPAPPAACMRLTDCEVRHGVYGCKLLGQRQHLLHDVPRLQRSGPQVRPTKQPCVPECCLVPLLSIKGDWLSYARRSHLNVIGVPSGAVPMTMMSCTFHNGVGSAAIACRHNSTHTCIQPAWLC